MPAVVALADCWAAVTSLSCADRAAEFYKICLRVGLGFAVLGFVGFFVKMIFIVRAPFIFECRVR